MAWPLHYSISAEMSKVSEVEAKVIRYKWASSIILADSVPLVSKKDGIRDIVLMSFFHLVTCLKGSLESVFFL